jgi:hypothetical protein
MTPDPRTFLEHFPATRRGPIANWFHAAVRAGAQTPLQVLAAVRATCHRRLAWGDTPDASLVLARLDTDQAGALAYAKSLIAYEALPYGERQRVKAERSFAYLKQSMMGKEATAAQLSFLRALGYRGEPPADRAAASALIEHLQTKGGQA